MNVMLEMMGAEDESSVNPASFQNDEVDECDNGGHQNESKSDRIQKVIDQAQMSARPILDLSKLNITFLPQTVLDWSNLEHMSLESNRISKLPENFFENLRNLKWLDLRSNCLMFIPKDGLGSHQCLKNLLLQGNRIKVLPLELGLIPTLRGLSLSDNPLEFPPPVIVRQGTVEVLQFLRDQLEEKSARAPVEISDLNRMTQLSIRDNESDASSTDDEVPGQPSSVFSYRSVADNNLAFQPRPAALHQPPSLNQIRQQHREKVSRAGGSGKKSSNLSNKSRRKSDTSKREGTKMTQYSIVTPYGKPRSASLIEETAHREQLQARIKVINEKQDSIIQRRRNFDALSDFRQDSKDLQRKKYREVLNRGQDYTDTASVAPYGYEADASNVPTRTELHKQEIRQAHERIARPMSPGSREKMEQERATRDRELEAKVKQHTTSMIERRKRQKGSAADEMQAARRELEAGLQLERELQQRRKELEYRFQAFTGDMPLTRK